MHTDTAHFVVEIKFTPLGRHKAHTDFSQKDTYFSLTTCKQKIKNSLSSNRTYGKRTTERMRREPTKNDQKRTAPVYKDLYGCVYPLTLYNVTKLRTKSNHAHTLLGRFCMRWC